MERYFVKRIDEEKRYAICDRISHTGYVYSTGHRIAEAYDLDRAMIIVDALNKEERRVKTKRSQEKEA